MASGSKQGFIPKGLQPWVRPLHRLVQVGIRVAVFPFCRVHPHPIIVLGNQKSGTTVVAALLSKMTGLSVTLDLRREMIDPSFESLKNGALSIERFIARNKFDFSRAIVKDPGLAVFYEELSGCLPQARFVFVMRDPRDNIRSILNRLRILGTCRELSSEFRAGVSRGWSQVLDGRWLGLEGGTHIEMLAARWNLFADCHIEHGDEMVTIRYEDFMADKVGSIAGIAETLGLSGRHDISDRVDVPYQPAGDRDVNWVEFFGNSNLERINQICGRRMAALGYKIAAVQARPTSC